MKKRFVFFMSAFLFWSSVTEAEVKIEFPDEELSTESVLPVFEQRVAVRNRRVKHAKKFEFNLMAGMVVSEALYDPFQFGASLTYHIDSTHGLQFMATFFNGGLNSNGEDLRDGKIIQKNGNAANSFDAEQAPNKNTFLALNYQYNAYYGKISLASDNIMNLTLSGLFGVGAYLMDGLTAPALNLGASQKLYFNSKVALSFDILFSILNGPDITSAGFLETGAATQPDASDFDSKIQFDTNVFVGVSFLL